MKNTLARLALVGVATTLTGALLAGCPAPGADDRQPATTWEFVAEDCDADDLLEGDKDCDDILKPAPVKSKTTKVTPPKPKKTRR